MTDEVAALRRELDQLRDLAGRERRLLDEVLLQSPYGIIVSDAQGKLIVENPAAQRIWAGRATTAEVRDWGQYRAFHPDGRPFAPEDWSMARALRTGQRCDAEELRFQRFDGSFGVMLGGSAPVFGPDGALDGAVAVFADVTQMKRGEAAQRLLADASAVLASSLDYEPTLKNVAGLAVPAFADFCFFDVVERGGEVRRVSHARSEEAGALLAQTRWVRSERTDMNLCALSSGKTGLHAVVDDAWMRDVGTSPEHLALLRALAIRSLLTVPLTIHGRILGALTLCYAESGGHAPPSVSAPERRYDAVDVPVIEELARRAAIAVDNARLYEKLHDEERRFHAVFEHALDAILITDDSKRIVDGNPAACALFGLSRDELLTRRAPDLVAPSDRSQIEELWEDLRAVGEQRGELAILRRDGSVRHVEYTATANVLPGRHLSMLRDVDARKRAEASLKFLGEASIVLASSLEYDATLASVAKLAVPAIADWAAVDMLDDDGKLRRLALAHADPEKVARVWELARRYPTSPDEPFGTAKVLRTGEPDLVPEIPYDALAAFSSDPELLTSMRELGLRSWMCVPLRVRHRTVGTISFACAESGRRLGASDLTLAEDLARRASVAIDNALSYREAREANRLKDEFLATVSHELRTPLNAILGWSGLLQSKAGDPVALRRGLETIERNARAQARLIDDVLDVSRIISGKLHIELRRADLVGVVRQALEVVRPMATAKGVELVAELASTPCELVGDTDRLQQIAWNLLSNAVKFTPAGGTVTARVSRVGTGVEMRVADTGQGISPAFLPFIFDRFRQADSSTTRTHGGLGLGLAIVRHLVELHGGQIRAESAGEGQGAIFVVVLPVRAVHVGSEPDPRDAAGRGAPAEAAQVRTILAGLRVVVCDDEPDARELLCELLSGYGADVAMAASGAEALELVTQLRPDVLVSDIGMPDEDGYTFLRRVRALPPDRGGRTPALALTAYVREEDARRALAAGFQLHAPKPVDPRELIALVANLGGRVTEA